ncbi:MAG TPA: hypothetical protein VLD36_11390, partial [Burkholderiales bacterium]|nr:hypothetical protein [Burkholderiales bacterium]
EKLSKQTLAPPVDPARPAAALARALQFLGQPAKRGIERAAPREILSQAVARWDRARIPRRRAAPIED